MRSSAGTTRSRVLKHADLSLLLLLLCLIVLLPLLLLPPLLLLLLQPACPWSSCCLASLLTMAVTLLLSGCLQWLMQCGRPQQVREAKCWNRLAVCCCYLLKHRGYVGAMADAMWSPTAGE
jgi:hypothetical protein